jgi:hypothetical protein
MSNLFAVRYSDARQRFFAVRAMKNARQRSFTVQKTVVCPLPCVFEKNVWQMHCHAFLFLYCALESHGKFDVSRSDML